MKEKYYFSISITGFTTDKKDIENLKSNLESEVWQEHVAVEEPIFRKIPEDVG